PAIPAARHVRPGEARVPAGGGALPAQEPLRPRLQAEERPLGHVLRALARLEAEGAADADVLRVQDRLREDRDGRRLLPFPPERLSALSRGSLPHAHQGRDAEERDRRGDLPRGAGGPARDQAVPRGPLLCAALAEEAEEGDGAPGARAPEREERDRR